MNTKQESIRNIGSYNFARGIGIIFVLVAHTYSLFVAEKSSSNILFSHAGEVFGGGVMMMFFIISGLGFYKRRPARCIKTQSRMLLRPYYIVAVAVLISKLGLAFIRQRSFWKHGGELLLTYLFGLNVAGGGTIAGFPVESIGIFWFIWALFGGWIIYNQISQVSSEKVKNGLVCICVIFGYLLTIFSKVYPFCIHTMLLAVGGIDVGMRIRKNKILESRWPAGLWIILLFSAFISLAWGNVSIVLGQWKLGPLDVCGSFAIGILLVKFFSWIDTKNIHTKAVEQIEKIGFYSIWVVCIHAYEKVIFPWYTLGNRFDPLISIVICLIGRSCVIYFIYCLVRKSKQYIMVNRRRRKNYEK